MDKLENIITGEQMQKGEFEYDLQEFILTRMEEITSEGDDFKSQFICYRRGVLDGIKMALALSK